MTFCIFARQVRQGCLRVTPSMSTNRIECDFITHVINLMCTPDRANSATGKSSGRLC